MLTYVSRFVGACAIGYFIFVGVETTAYKILRWKDAYDDRKM